MNFTTDIVNACCGKKAILIKIDRPIMQDLVQILNQNGLKENDSFFKAGILYIDSPDLLITAPFGQNQFQIKCKFDNNCPEKIKSFEDLLKSIP